jgi:hypothetical protein
MTATLIPAELDATKRQQRRRRVKRGLVASYIREISGRHGSREDKRVAPRREARKVLA